VVEALAEVFAQRRVRRNLSDDVYALDPLSGGKRTGGKHAAPMDAGWPDLHIGSESPGLTRAYQEHRKTQTTQRNTTKDQRGTEEREKHRGARSTTSYAWRRALSRARAPAFPLTVTANAGAFRAARPAPPPEQALDRRREMKCVAAALVSVRRSLRKRGNRPPLVRSRHSEPR
jgi:hypothetical protein